MRMMIDKWKILLIIYYCASWVKQLTICSGIMKSSLAYLFKIFLLFNFQCVFCDIYCYRYSSERAVRVFYNSASVGQIHSTLSLSQENKPIFIFNMERFGICYQLTDCTSSVFMRKTFTNEYNTLYRKFNILNK